MVLEHALAFRLRRGVGGRGGVRERAVGASEGVRGEKRRRERRRLGRAPGFALGVVCTALMRTTSSSRESRLFAA